MSSAASVQSLDPAPVPVPPTPMPPCPLAPLPESAPAPSDGSNESSSDEALQPPTPTIADTRIADARRSRRLMGGFYARGATMSEPRDLDDRHVRACVRPARSLRRPARAPAPHGRGSPATDER